MNPSFRVAALVAASFVALASCEKSASRPANQPTPATNAEPAQITNAYKVRGIIESLPEAGKPASELMIRHEAINDFVDGQGAVVGMNAMTMPFPKLAPDVTLDGFAVGDKIAFEFSNTWSGPENARRPGWTITSISKLPADTELVFTKKSVPAPDSPR